MMSLISIVARSLGGATTASRVPNGGLPLGALAFRWPNIALLGCCLLACGGSAEAEPTEEPRVQAEPPAPGATRVEAAVVSASATALRVVLPGEVAGSRDALLAASLGGFVEAVLVEEGEDVRANQVIARVDSATQGARLGQMRVELDAAQHELERAERLVGSISEQSIDAARTRVAAARAAVRTAQVMAGRATVRAPFAGTIATLNVERGEVMAPGQPLARLIQLDPVLVTLAVPDRDVVALRPGLPAVVRAPALGEAVAGHVRRISPAARVETRAFEVEIEVANANRRLLPGMIANVEIETDAGEQQVVIPQYMLVTRVDGNGVFRIDNDVARWQPVEVGSVVRDQVVIASGLEAGTEIVVTGHRELQDGDALLVARRGRCCTAGRVVYTAPGEVAQAPAPAPAAEVAE